MARVNPSPTQWAAARAIYESDSEVSLSQLGDSLGVTKAAVEMRIKREGWNKPPVPETLAARANAKADSDFDAERRKETAHSSKRAAPVYVDKNLVPDRLEDKRDQQPDQQKTVEAAPDKPVEPVEPDPLAAEVDAMAARKPAERGPAVPPIPEGMNEVEAARYAVETADQARAALVLQHRKEWHAVRQIAYQAIKTKDTEQARHVKVVAESIKIIQEGERKAWGMDMDDGKKPPTVQVVINRRSGVRIGQS